MRFLALWLVCCAAPIDAPLMLPDEGSIAFADANPESADEDDAPPYRLDTAAPPVPVVVPRPSPPRPCMDYAQTLDEHSNPEMHEQTQKVKATRYDLQALEFYLVDKRAQKNGQIDKAWKQPPLAAYKTEPWCHAPAPHGEHRPPPPPPAPADLKKTDLPPRRP